MDESLYFKDLLESDFLNQVYEQIALECSSFIALLIHIESTTFQVFVNKISPLKGIPNKQKQQINPLIEKPGLIESITKVNFQLPIESQVQEIPINTSDHPVIPNDALLNPQLTNSQKGYRAVADSPPPSQSIERESNFDPKKKKNIIVPPIEQRKEHWSFYLKMSDKSEGELKMTGFFKITVAEVVDHNMIKHPPSHQTLPASVTPSFSLKLYSALDNLK